MNVVIKRTKIQSILLNLKRGTEENILVCIKRVCVCICVCIYTMLVRITHRNTQNLTVINYEWDWKKKIVKMYSFINFLFKILTYTIYFTINTVFITF